MNDTELLPCPRKLIAIDDLQKAFHNWLIEYECDELERWSHLAPSEWNTLIDAQWKAFSAQIARTAEDGK